MSSRLNNKIQICVAANTAWYLNNFRLNLIKELIKSGFDVVALAPFDPDSTAAIVATGARFENVSIDCQGKNPFIELKVIARIKKIISQNQFDLIFSYTPKVNIYMGIAARMYGIKWFPNISGVGAIGSHNLLVIYALKVLYKISLNGATRVFFQNDDDMHEFLRQRLVKRSQCLRVPGSGVDIKHFCCDSFTSVRGNDLVFLMFGRLLWDKGIGEFVEAARYIKKRYTGVKFRVMGFVDNSRKNSVANHDILSWVGEGVIDYSEPSSDVRPIIWDCDCVVLPSYYGEGVPRSLLESAAMMRPIITTSLPGCRDAVLNGVTGFTCNPRDVNDLILKIEKVIKMTPENRKKMGDEARKYMIKYFNERIVLDAYINIIKECLVVKYK